MTHHTLQRTRWICGIVGLLVFASCVPSTPEDLPPSNSGPCPSGFVRNDQGLCRAEACLMPGPMALRTVMLSGTAATRFAVGDTVVLEGLNFSANPAQNTVTFDGVPATSLSLDPADPTRRLFAVVPVGIPDAPVQSADTAKSGVCIQALAEKASVGATSITVAAPLPLQPMIKSISPDTQREGGEITIMGASFTASSVVKIRDLSAAVVRSSSTELVVTVPDFLDIQAGALVPSAVKIIVPEGGQAIFSGSFRVRGQ